jgi:ABC-2 type transport system permease protein
MSVMPTTTWPEGFSAWIAFRTLLEREVMRYMKLAVQTIVAPFLSNVLFLAIFGGLLSQRPSGVPGVPYVRFLIPGLVVMGAVTSAFSNPVFSLIAMKYQNTLQDLCLYPLSASARFFAFTLAGALRGFLVGAMTFLAAALFGGAETAQPVAFWLCVGLLAFVAAAGGLAVGLALSSFEQANFAISLLLTPALFLGGVFFDARSAPAWLGFVARCDPLTFLVGQGRRLFLGGGAIEPLGTVIAGTALCVIALTAGAQAVASGKGMKLE